MPADPTYHTAVLPSGVRLAYTDSWAAQAGAGADRPSEYTTVIALHGGGCNSAAWTPMVPYLPAGVRLLAYNQRSYAGSDGAVEFAKAAGTDATAAYVEDLVGFVEYVVSELGVPPLGTGGAGGIVLLAWSKATNLAIALLAATLPLPPSPTNFLSSLPPATTSSHTHPCLSTHLHSVLLFEPGAPNLGLPPPADFLAAVGPALAFPPSAADPFRVADAMGAYVAGYRQGADTAQLPASSVGVVQGLVGEGVWEPAAIGTAGWELAATPREVGELARAALVGSRVPVGLVYGGLTVGLCEEACAELEEWWKEAGVKGEGGKRAVRRVERMNHVGQVLMPGEFVAAVLELVDELGASQ